MPGEKPVAHCPISGPVQESTPQLASTLARVLHGEAPPNLGPFLMASPEDIQALLHLRAQLEPRWKMLQVAGEALGSGGSESAAQSQPTERPFPAAPSGPPFWVA